MRRLGALVLATTLACLAEPALAQSALGQAAEAGRAGTPPPVGKPVCVAYCGGTTQSAPHTTTKLPSYGYKPSMAIGAAVFGSLLDELLSTDSAPDPEVLRRQEEERRQAEAEAQRRAEEERIRHDHLLASLKSLPLARSFSATPGTQGTTELGLTALRSLDAPAAAGSTTTDPLDGAAEKLRSDASLGWDTADTRFAVRWQPLPLAKSATLPLARQLCRGQQCAWPVDAGDKIARLAPPKGATHSLDREAIVQLLRKPGNAGLTPEAALIAGLMARVPETPGASGRYVISEQLKQFSGNAAKELIWVIVARGLEETGTLGKGITLMRDVYDLASTDMQDAISAAGWLGSASTDAPPEITSPEEASIPFLNRALGTSEVFGKGAAEYASAGIDASQLANKLLSLWRNSP